MTTIALHIIRIECLRANPANIRTDLGDLSELATSIKALGVLQPLIVTHERGGEYIIVDGHRRLAAARIAGAPALPCLVTTDDGEHSAIIMMLATAMHKSLTPMEQAVAFQGLYAAGMSMADIAASSGYSTSTVHTRLLLLELPKEAQKMVEDQTITLENAVNLARQVKATGHSGATSITPKFAWLRQSHPLAGAARMMCDHALERVIVGNTACGQCWEEVIRADERGEVQPVRETAKVENIEWLLEQEPLTLVQMATRLGVVKSAIEHICARNERRDLLLRMLHNQRSRENAS